MPPLFTGLYSGVFPLPGAFSKTSESHWNHSVEHSISGPRPNQNAVTPPFSQPVSAGQPGPGTTAFPVQKSTKAGSLFQAVRPAISGEHGPWPPQGMEKRRRYSSEPGPPPMYLRINQPLPFKRNGAPRPRSVINRVQPKGRAAQIRDWRRPAPKGPPYTLNGAKPPPGQPGRPHHGGPGSDCPGDNSAPGAGQRFAPSHRESPAL